MKQIKNFKATWNEAGLKKLDFNSFGLAYPNVPKQRNGYALFFLVALSLIPLCIFRCCASIHLAFLFVCLRRRNDCGIFSMKYLELFTARNPAQCSFSHLDITAFRMKYAHDIFMCDYNVENDAKNLAIQFSS
jgi:hypothetical protein